MNIARALYGAASGEISMTPAAHSMREGGISPGGPAFHWEVPLFDAHTRRHQADTQRIQANTGIYGAETTRLGMFLNAQTGAAQGLAQIESQDAARRASPFAAGIISRANQQRSTLNDRYGHFMEDLWSKALDQRADVLGLLENVGQASRDRIYRDAAAERGSMGSQLAGTGLYNTSVLGSLQTQVDRNRNEALGMLDEGLRQQQAQYLQMITSEALNRHHSLASQKLDGQQQHISNVLQADASMRGQVGTNQRASGAGVQALTDMVSGKGAVATAMNKSFPGLFDPNSNANPLYQIPGTAVASGNISRASLPWRQ